MRVRRQVATLWIAAAVIAIGFSIASAAGHKVHTVFSGAVKRVSNSKIGDPSGGGAWRE
jgi:hypothetical protein